MLNTKLYLSDSKCKDYYSNFRKALLFDMSLVFSNSNVSLPAPRSNYYTTTPGRLAFNVLKTFSSKPNLVLRVKIIFIFP
jgi:hypothetical protein